MFNLQQGDCLELLKTLEDGSVDMILTDPPYGINYSNFEWDKEDNIFFDKWTKECFRVLKPEGTMWSFMAAKNVFKLIKSCEENKFLFNDENWVVWCRSKGRASSKHLKSTREDILHFTKSKKHTWNDVKVLREVIAPYMVDGLPRGWFVDEEGKRVRWTGLGNVWTYSQPFHKFKSDLAYGHPHQKPLLMLERLLLLSSNEGDTILDPFMGSGSTGVACANLNRNFIGFELDEKYFNIAKERIEK